MKKKIQFVNNIFGVTILLFFGLSSCDNQKRTGNVAKTIKTEEMIVVDEKDTLRFPVIVSEDKVLEATINKNLRYNAGSISELKESLKNSKVHGIGGTSFLGYDIKCDSAGVLSIAYYEVSTGGAHDIHSTDYVNINSVTGNKILLKTISPELLLDIKNEHTRRLMGGLGDMINYDIQDNDSRTENYIDCNLIYKVKSARNGIEVDNFFVTEEGLTFICYSSFFATADRNVEPSDDYFFSWKDLKEKYNITPESITKF